MIDGVGDGRGHADDPDFADSFRADRVDVRIVLRNENHVDRTDVGVDRHQVLGQVHVRKGTEVPVEMRLLQERHADSLDDAAVVLAARGLGVQDAAARERRHDAVHAHDAEVGIDAHFREHGTEGAGRIRIVRLRLFVHRGVHRVEIVPAEDGRIRLTARRIALQHQPPVGGIDVVRIGAVQR